MRLRKQLQEVPSQESLNELLQQSRRGELPGTRNGVRGDYFLSPREEGDPVIVFETQLDELRVYSHLVEEEDFAVKSVGIFSRRTIS